MIPRIIHYFWFGNKPMNSKIVDCIQSWKYILPDYKIMQWNERNYPLNSCFEISAYLDSNYAFLTDYARLKVLKEYGGFYLDTDMLILRTLDGFLDYDLVMGWEDDHFINGAIIGSSNRNRFISDLLNNYEKLKYSQVIKDKYNYTIPRMITSLYTNNSDNYISDKILLCPNKVFYPVPYEDRENNYIDYISENTIAVHLWSASWVSLKKNNFINKITNYIKIMLKKHF